MRATEPLHPSPDGKFTGIPAYIAHAIHIAGGSANSLAAVIGLTSGSRVSDWRNGYGVPGVLMALRLAKFTGDSAESVLVMAGHADVVEALHATWAVGPQPPQAAHLARLEADIRLQQAIRLLEMAHEAVN
jgi:hypothetical protein